MIKGTISEILTLACARINAGQYAEAEALLRSLLEVAPENDVAFYLLGVTLGQSGRMNEALDYLAAAVKRRDDVAEYFINLGKAHLALGMRREAVNALRQARQLEAGNTATAELLAGLLRDDGRRLYADGQLDQAEAALCEALGCNSNDEQASRLLAALRRNRGLRYEALRREPLSACDANALTTHARLGRDSESNGRCDDAKAHWRAALTLDPAHAEAWERLAKAAAPPPEQIRLRRRAGVLDTPAHRNVGGSLTLLAVYDLTVAPPTWDFATWLIAAEMARARHGFDKLAVCIRKNPFGNGFRDDNLPPSLEERRFMLDHVARPLIGLIGAEPADGDLGVGHRFGYLAKQISDAARQGEAVPRFRPSAQAEALVERWCGRGYVTITLREAEYWPARNSRIDDWLRVAHTLEARGRRVIFIRDTAFADAPLDGTRTAPWAALDVDLRCALYAGASLNLGVNNGPMMLAVCGDKPYLLFKQIVSGSLTQNEEYMRNGIGVAPGEQLPWAKPTQRWTWADDAYDAIMAEIDALGLL